MKKIIFLLSVPLLLSSCTVGGKYFSNLFECTQLNPYQIYDYYEFEDFSIKYDGSNLSEKQCAVDLSTFDTSKSSTFSLRVALNISPETYTDIEVMVNNRTSSNFLMIGDECSEQVLYYTNLLSDKAGLDLNFYSLSSNGASLKDHDYNFYSKESIYSLKKFNSETNEWEEEKTCSLYSAINDSEIIYEVICFSDAIGESHIDNSRYLTNLINSINNYYSAHNLRRPILCYNEQFAYENGTTVDNNYYELFSNNSDVMIESISSIFDIYEQNEDLSFVIPSGEIINAALKDEQLSELEFYKDGKTLNENTSGYLTSLYILSKVSGLAPSTFTFIGEEDSPIITSEIKSTFDNIVINYL